MFTCRECRKPSETVRLCVLDGYDQIRRTFAVPLSIADQDTICTMEDRGGGELYRVLLCRDCRNAETER